MQEYITLQSELTQKHTNIALDRNIIGILNSQCKLFLINISNCIIIDIITNVFIITTVQSNRLLASRLKSILLET